VFCRFFRAQFRGSVFRVPGSVFRVLGFGFRFSCVGFRDPGSGIRDPGSGVKDNAVRCGVYIFAGIRDSGFGYRAGREFEIEQPSLFHFSARLHDVIG